MTVRRSPVPVSVTEPEQQAFLDATYRVLARIAALSPLSPGATDAEMQAKINEIIEAARWPMRN